MESLITIYKRAMQYCMAAYGKEPDELHLLEDGSFCAIFGNSCRGEYYEDEEYFNESCLTSDLDAVYDERKKREEKERERQRIEYEARENSRKLAEKENRRRNFLELKKEFEP